MNPFRYWRRNAGLSRQQAAKYLDVPLSLIRHIETGGFIGKSMALKIYSKINVLCNHRSAYHNNGPSPEEWYQRNEKAAHPLRKWRGKSKITQRDLAELLGYSCSVISHIENGGRTSLFIAQCIEQVTAGQVGLTDLRRFNRIIYAMK